MLRKDICRIDSITVLSSILLVRRTVYTALYELTASRMHFEADIFITQGCRGKNATEIQGAKGEVARRKFRGSRDRRN